MKTENPTMLTRWSAKSSNRSRENSCKGRENVQVNSPIWLLLIKLPSSGPLSNLNNLMMPIGSKTISSGSLTSTEVILPIPGPSNSIQQKLMLRRANPSSYCVSDPMRGTLVKKRSAVLSVCVPARAVHQMKVNRDVPAVSADTITVYDSVTITGSGDTDDVKRKRSYSAGPMTQIMWNKMRKEEMRQEKTQWEETGWTETLLREEKITWEIMR